MTDPEPVVPLSHEIPPPPAAFLSIAGIRKLGAAGVMGVITLAVPPIGILVLAAITANTDLAAVLRDNAWGPYASAIGFGLLGGFALLPTAALAIFAGWAFHFQIGFPVAVAGFTLASAVGYSIARRFSGRTVVDLIDKNPRWRTVHRALLHSGRVRTFLIVVLLRVPSIPPFALTNVALATLHVRFLPFLLGTAIGVMPRTAAYVWVAEGAEKLNVKDSGGWPMLIVSIAITLLVLVVLTVLARRALEKVTSEDKEGTGEVRTSNTEHRTPNIE